MKTKHGFTFIELLVVVAILAIVASMFVAAVGCVRKAKAESASVKCFEDERKLTRFTIVHERTELGFPDLFLITDTANGNQTLVVQVGYGAVAIPVLSATNGLEK